MADNTSVQLTDEQLTELMKWAKDQLSGERVDKYRKARQYYDGEQEMGFATDKFTNTFGNIFQTFSYNRCGPVVDSMTDRLQLLSFDPVSQKPGAAPADAATDPIRIETERIYRLNRMDRRQNDQIAESLKCGDAYVVVWLDGVAPDGQVYPTISVNYADQVVIRFNQDTKTKEAAVKAWQRSDKFWRVTIYTGSFLYKYVTTAKKDEFPAFSDLVPYQPDPAEGTEAELWPLPNPTGVVPVFHFNNNAPEGEYGRSELRDVIPLQDALNKACMDMMVAMEYGAFPQRWATGLQLGIPNPVTGKIPSPFTSGPGEVWTAPKDGQFGSFEVANLTQFVTIQDSFDSKISNVSRVPEHWLKMSAGSNLSGETLKTAEGPFVAKLEDRQISFGNEWENVFSYALAFMGKIGVMLNAVWKSAELRSDTDKLNEAMLKKQLGWSEDQIQREFGLDQATIDRMKQENLEKAQAAQVAIGATEEGGTTPPLREVSPNQDAAA